VKNGGGSVCWGRGRCVGSEDSGFWGYADKPDGGGRPGRFDLVLIRISLLLRRNGSDFLGRGSMRRLVRRWSEGEVVRIRIYRILEFAEWVGGVSF